MSVVTSEDFEKASDAFKASCTVAILIQLAEENVATQPAPPVLAFQVPQTSVLSGVARPVLNGFSRYLAEPQNAPLFWLCRGTGGKDPVSWSMPLAMLAETVVNEQLVAAVKERQDALITAANTAAASGSATAAAAAAALPQQQQNPALLLSTKRSPFPIKLYANFRPTKRHDIFPFHAHHLSGSALVTALNDTALQCLKRSVAIMNVDTFSNFYSELNPQDMKRLKDFCLMDSPSMSIRAEFAQFHKNILATISIKSWPVMIHSLETGRTLTLSIPAHVQSGGRSYMHNKSSPAKEQQQTQPFPGVIGIQAQRYASSPNSTTSAASGSDDAESVADENKNPTCFGDIVSAMALKMNPNYVPHTNDGRVVQDDLRKRLRIGGMPITPPAEVPLRWLMEHMVGADLCLHILLLPFALN